MNDVPFYEDLFAIADLDRAVEHGILDEEARIACSDRWRREGVEFIGAGFRLD